MLRGTLPSINISEEEEKNFFSSLSEPKTPSGVRRKTPSIEMNREELENLTFSAPSLSKEELERKKLLQTQMSDISTLEHQLYGSARAFQQFVEKPIKGIAGFISMVGAGTARVLGKDKIADKWVGYADEWSAPSLGVVSPWVEKERERRGIAYANAGFGWSIMNSMVENGVDLAALLMHMNMINTVSPAGKFGPVGKGVGKVATKAGFTPVTATNVATYAERASKMAGYKFLTTPSADVWDRTSSAAWMLAYNFTPYVANWMTKSIPLINKIIPTVDIGMKAFIIDSALNTALSSPIYKKLGDEHGWFTEEFLLEALPNFMMDIGMAWGTRAMVNKDAADYGRTLQFRADKVAEMRAADGKWSVDEIREHQRNLTRSLDGLMEKNAYETIYGNAHLGNKFQMEVKLETKEGKRVGADENGKPIYAPSTYLVSKDSMAEINAKTGLNLKQDTPYNVVRFLDSMGVKFSEDHPLFRTAAQIKAEQQKNSTEHMVASKKIIANGILRKDADIEARFGEYPEARRIINEESIRGLSDKMEAKKNSSAGKLGDYITDPHLRAVFKDVIDTPVRVSKFEGAAEGVYRPDTKTIHLPSGDKISQKRIVDALLEEGFHALEHRLSEAFDKPDILDKGINREDLIELGNYEKLPEIVTARDFVNYTREELLSKDISKEVVESIPHGMGKVTSAIVQNNGSVKDLYDVVPFKELNQVKKSLSKMLSAEGFDETFEIKLGGNRASGILDKNNDIEIVVLTTDTGMKKLNTTSRGANIADKVDRLGWKIADRFFPNRAFDVVFAAKSEASKYDLIDFEKLTPEKMKGYHELLKQYQEKQAKEKIEEPVKETIKEDIDYKGIIKHIKEKGGITLSFDGKIIEKGYAFSILDKTDERTLTIDANLRKMFIESFNELKEKYGDDPKNHLGGWTEDGKFIVDVSRVDNNIKEALYAGIIKRQTAIGDLGKYSKGEDGDIRISKEIIDSLEPLSRGSLGNRGATLRTWEEVKDYYYKQDYKNPPEVEREVLSALGVKETAKETPREEVKDVTKETPKEPTREESMTKQIADFREAINTKKTALEKESRFEEARLLKATGERSIAGIALTQKQQQLLTKEGITPIKPPSLQKLGIKQDSPKIVMKTYTALKNRMQALARGSRIGATEKRKDILEAGKYLDRILKKAGVDKDLRSKFTTEYRNLTGVENLEKNIEAITARAERLVEDKTRRTLLKYIEKTLPSKGKKGPRGVVEGKYAEAEKYFSFLRGEKDLLMDTNKDGEPIIRFASRDGKQKRGEGFHLYGNRAAAQAEITRIINESGKTQDDGKTKEVSAIDGQKMAILRMVGAQHMTSKELYNTLRDIQSLKEKGKMLSVIRDMAREAELSPLKEAAAEDFLAAKQVKSVAGEEHINRNPITIATDGFFNWSSGTKNILEKLTYAKTFRVADEVVRRISNARSGEEKMRKKWHNAFIDKIEEIYGKSTPKLMNEIAKEERVALIKDNFGGSQEIKLSQAQAGYWWGQLRDPSQRDAVRETFTDGLKFSKDAEKDALMKSRVQDRIEAKIDKYVSPEMKQLIDYLQFDWFKGIRKDGVQQRYLEKFKIDMADNPFYIPKEAVGDSFKDITNLLMGEAFPGFATTIPGGVKGRTKGTLFKKADIFSVAKNHLVQMTQFTHFDRVVSDMRTVFTDKAVLDSITRSGNKKTHRFLMYKIDDIARGGKASQATLKYLDSFVGNFTKATLMLNYVPFFKQLTSYPAVLIGREGLTLPEFVKGNFEYFKDVKGWNKFLTEDSTFIEARLTRGWDIETSMAFKNNNKKFFTQRYGMDMGKFVKQAVVMPTRGGDILPIIPNMAAKYIAVRDTLTKEGKLTKQEIHKIAMMKAENLMADTQQSPLPEHLGRVQMYHSITGAMMMYKTTPIQYYREVWGTMRMAQRGQVGWDKAIQTFVVGHFVLPMLFQFVSDGFQINEERQKRAAILGTFNYIPIVGDMMATLYSTISMEEDWRDAVGDVSPMLGLVSEFQETLVRTAKLLGGDVKDKEKREKSQKILAKTIWDLTAKLTGKLPTAASTTATGAYELHNEETTDLWRLIYSSYALDEDKDDEKGDFPSLDFGDLPDLDFGDLPDLDFGDLPDLDL
jgi:hypothetical protein